MKTCESCETLNNDSKGYTAGRWGIRHGQCFMLFLAHSIAYTNRVCMSIAIVSMQEESREGGLSDGQIGMILSSFLWGYTLIQIPMGYLARISNAKMVLAIGILTSGFSSILCPFVYHQSGVNALIGCRVLVGICQACLHSSTHTLLAKWVPPNERGRLGTITYVGGLFGTVIAYPIAGFLIDANGWESVFYYFGAAAIIWAFVFFFFGAASPEESSGKACCGIRESEKSYIERGLGVFEEVKTTNNKKNKKIPWKGIFTSVPFWALFITHCGQNWGFYMLLTEMPRYMFGVLKFEIKENGVISALPYVAFLLLTLPVSWLSDWSEKKGVKRVFVRKICNTIGHWGPALAIIALGFVSHGDTTLAVVLLVLAVGLNVGAYCGFHLNHLDLSPNYAGILVGITNCAAAGVGLMGPLLVGNIVTDTSSADQWNIVWYITGGLYFLANLIFISFASGDIQWWNNSEQPEEMGTEMFMRPQKSSVATEDTPESEEFLASSGEAHGSRESVRGKRNEKRRWRDDERLYKPKQESQC